MNTYLKGIATNTGIKYTNMNHLATYYRFSNTEQKTLFIEGFKNALEEMTNGN